MSHFVVMVTNTDSEPVESQLEPFYEQGEETDYFMKKEYFVLRKEVSIDTWLKNEKSLFMEWIKDAEKRLATSREEEEKESLKRSLKQQRKGLAELEKIEKITDIDEKIEAIQEWNGGGIDKKGLYWVCNPNAKWDWWSEGGRWNNWLITDDWQEVNKCKVKDLNLDNMRINDMGDRAKYWVKETEIAKRDGREPWFWDYEGIPTIEEYIKGGDCLVAPYAFLHEGEWVGKGEMGWWGLSDDEYSDEEWAKKFQEFIKSLDPESEVTIVDCHI